MVYEICAAVATLIFVILAYFIVQSLRELKNTLMQVNQVTARLQTKIDPIGLEALQLLQKTNDITESINQKINAFNPLFNSISDAASVLEEKTHTMKENIHAERIRPKTKDALSSVVELVASGILLWQQIKKRR